MQDESTATIPLRDHHGRVRAVAIIDAADFAWLNQWRWHLHPYGYPQRGGQLKIRMHRQILGLEPGDKHEGDHINMNPLDNRRSNLRIGTRAQNKQNLRSQRGSSSRYRGVAWHKHAGKWRAQGRLNGKTFYLGLYEDELDAARASQAWRLANMPFTVEAPIV